MDEERCSAQAMVGRAVHFECNHPDGTPERLSGVVMDQTEEGSEVGVRIHGLPDLCWMPVTMVEILEEDEFPPRDDADALDFLAGYLYGREGWGETQIETVAVVVAETGRHVAGLPASRILDGPGSPSGESESLLDLLGDPVLDPPTAWHLGERIWGRFSNRLPNGARVRQIGYAPRRARVEIEGVRGERCTRTIRTHDDAREAAEMALRLDRGEPTERDLALCRVRRAASTGRGR